jgi:nucleotide-binding universal stress UspA family protein
MTIKRILAATDFSSRSRHAVDRAAHLAHRFDAELRIVHVVPDVLRSGRPFEHERSLQVDVTRGAERALECIGRDVQKRFSISASWTLIYGKASTAILEAQAAFSADLLVIGAQGETEPGPMRALGGTTLKILPACTIPLLVVRLPVADHYRHLIVAVDNSPRADDVLAVARSFATGAHCCVVHAFEMPYARRLAALKLSSETIDTYAAEQQTALRGTLARKVADAGLDKCSEIRVMRGDPLTVLMFEIERLEPDLVVLGKHASGSRGSERIGSTLLRLAYGADCDLLHVPEKQARS